ncbi:hypothetical protein MDAP_001244 [Mitosporidium daphniae]
MTFEVFSFTRSRLFTSLGKPSPPARDIQLGKSILAAQADVLNFFNASHHLSTSAENYKENVLLSIKPLNVRIYGLSSYRSFFSFLNLSIAKLWCGIDQNTPSNRNRRCTQSKIDVQIVNFPDKAAIKESNLLTIQWKMKIIRYPPTFMSFVIMYPLTRRLYLCMKFLNAHNDHSFKDFKKRFEEGVYPERFFSKGPPQEHIVNGYSYFTFDKDGKILSHSIDNIIPPPRYSFTSIIFLLFRYPSLSSRLSYILPRSLSP